MIIKCGHSRASKNFRANYSTDFVSPVVIIFTSSIGTTKVKNVISQNDQNKKGKKKAALPRRTAIVDAIVDQLMAREEPRIS